VSGIHGCTKYRALPVNSETNTHVPSTLLHPGSCLISSSLLMPIMLRQRSFLLHARVMEGGRLGAGAIEIPAQAGSAPNSKRTCGVHCGA
jgi:hypothetical protein